MSRYNFIQTAEARDVRPCEVKPNDAFPIKIVAVAGFGNDWAAYYGPTGWTDEEIAENGDKLAACQAEPLFYALRNSGRCYRK